MRTLLMAVLVTGCGAQTAAVGEAFDDTFTDSKGKPVVYGADHRTDVYAHTDPVMRERAQQSTVALVQAGDIDTSNTRDACFRGSTLETSHNLCPGQRFASDPTAAFCSGTLIENDVVLTAGHCVTSARDCASARFVFNYYRTSATELHTITTADIFSCANIIARQERQTSEGPQDYALIRLDRPASPRFTPAPVRLAREPLLVGQQLGVIGSGSGVPFKIDTGGRVRSPGSGVSFIATTDTFGGNSGSGVYNEAGEVVGILVQGDTDYRREGSCNVVNTCTARGCSGETVVYASQALAAFCEHGRSRALCGAAPPTQPLPPSFTFSVNDTRSATRGTANQPVTLKAGQLLTAGTCGQAGADGTGDTYLRIAGPGPSRATVAQNDDACGGELSQVRFTAPVDGTYVIRAGCYGALACGGTVAFTIR